MKATRLEEAVNKLVGVSILKTPGLTKGRASPPAAYDMAMVSVRCSNYPSQEIKVKGARRVTARVWRWRWWRYWGLQARKRWKNQRKRWRERGGRRESMEEASWDASVGRHLNESDVLNLASNQPIQFRMHQIANNLVGPFSYCIKPKIATIRAWQKHLIKTLESVNTSINATRKSSSRPANLQL